MALPERIGLRFAAALWAAFGLACTSGDAPRELVLPPQTLTDAPTSTAEEERALVSPRREAETAAPDAATPSARPAAQVEPPAADGAEEREGRADGRTHTLVIRSGGTADVTPRTLYEASAEERQRRAGANAPVAVITNSNLAEQAAGGQLTVLGGTHETAAGTPADDPTTDANGVASPAAAPGAPGGGGTAAGPTADSAASVAGSTALSEEYWRGQALAIRLDWKSAIERVDELESEVEELRRRFYEEDDPFYRDNQIKPAWDRALDTLSAARVAAEEHERRLGRFLEEGRRAGALPGWLREGIEFEPPPTPADTPAERRRQRDPWEPKVLEEEPRDP